MSAEEPTEEVAIRPNKIIYSDLSKEQGALAVSCVNKQLEEVRVKPAGALTGGGSWAYNGDQSILYEITQTQRLISPPSSCFPSPQFTTEKDVATALKKEFDAKYGGTWQAIVGSCFGCSLTHKTKCVLHFQIEHTNAIMYVLLFQSDE